MLEECFMLSAVWEEVVEEVMGESRARTTSEKSYISAVCLGRNICCVGGFLEVHEVDRSTAPMEETKKQPSCNGELHATSKELSIQAST